MSEQQPIRLTKRRAQALLLMVERGIEAERTTIEQNYGVKFDANGIAGMDEEGFRLLAPGDDEVLADALESMIAALDAAAIISRRYA